MATNKDDLEDTLNLSTNNTESKPLTLMSNNSTVLSLFANIENFESAQRMAKLLSSSDLIPDQYRGNIPNTTIALEMAQRIGASPLAVMQNLYVVNGNPGWSAKFVIASLNSCGQFSKLRYVMEGEGTTRSCYAWAKDLADGERLEGPIVTWTMALEEGWVQKKGSKWKTMPEVMFRYRAASFFGKLYAPEITMGMQTAEELHDIVDLTPNSQGEYELPTKGMDGVKAKLKQHTQNNHAMDVSNQSQPDKTDNTDTTDTTIIDGQTVDTDTGEIIEEEIIVTTETETANDILKKNLQKKANKTSNTKNAHPDQF